MEDNYMLYLGDCLSVMDKLIEEGLEVDAIICDPPYGTTNCRWDSVIPFEEMWPRLNKLVKPNGAIVLFGSQPFTTTLIYSNIKNFKHQWIWDKNAAGNILSAKYGPLKVEEEILVFTRKGERVNYYPILTTGHKPLDQRPTKQTSDLYADVPGGIFQKSEKNKKFTERYPTNIIKVSARAKECNNPQRVHPTQKPVDLMTYLIKTYTQEGETVLDFTMGSGSTGVGCILTNRKFIGIELDEKYYTIARSRIEKAEEESR